MYWENPKFLLSLWIIPFIAWLLVYAHRKRSAAANLFAKRPMAERLVPAFGGARPWVRGALVIIAIGLLIVAAAGPRFGTYFEKVTRRGADVFVVLDVSRSMTAEDVTPNRLERAKSDIRDLLSRVVGDRVGLIVFAGKPVMKVPLTTDHGFFHSILNQIDSSSAPRGGTQIGDAIRKCIEALPKHDGRDQAIVLITDGEDHDSYPIKAAEHAAERGIKIFTVGLGDSGEGSRIPIRDKNGQLRYMKHEGKEIWTKVDQKLLKDIAMTTGGAYIPAGTKAYDLGQIYEENLEDLSRGEFQTEKRKRYHEQFQLFVCLAMILLLVELAIPSHAKTNTLVDNREARP